MDTTLAEKYIEEHKQYLNLDPPKGKCFEFRDGSLMTEKEFRSLFIDYTELNIIDRKIYRKFCEKLMENSELFCQLEYLIRKTDVEDTKKNLKLILQYVEYCHEPRKAYFVQYVADNTELFKLGSVMVNPQRSCLVTTPKKKTIPLCYLFYEVCVQAGIKTALAYVNEDNFKMRKTNKTQYAQSTRSACTAVYTEQADIDSAVDVLINSSRQALWKIVRILVQESVYEAVISALSTKGRRMIADRPRQYVEAFETPRGTVAVTIGDAEIEPGAVRVVTYRTVRELLALLAANPTHFLSLWCAELAQANEVAAAAPADYVWINGYGDFDGPPEVTLAIYNFGRAILMEPECYDRIARFSADWSSLGWEKRKSIVLDTLHKFPPDGKNHTEFSEDFIRSFHQLDLQKLFRSLENWKSQDQVQMQREKITLVVDNPKPKKIYKFELNDQDQGDILPALECVIRGHRVCIILDSVSWTKYEDLISAMNEVGIPIMHLYRYDEDDFDEEDSDIKLVRQRHPGHKKVIQTTYGTI